VNPKPIWLPTRTINLSQDFKLYIVLIIFQKSAELKTILLVSFFLQWAIYLILYIRNCPLIVNYILKVEKVKKTNLNSSFDLQAFF